ncbi:MAG: PEGA domain-containing protein, partial [Terracidiphilus sp.]
MLPRLHLKAIILGYFVCLALLPLASAQKAKLSRVQVEQAILAHLPDEKIAQQIQERGISFPVDRKSLGAFVSKKAGPLTLDALRDQIHEGVVEVRYTEPGSELVLDGKVAGNADNLGYFAFKEVPEGNHDLTVKKDGYRDYHVQFALANKEDKQLSLPLDWLGGFLSVSAQPSSSAIHITGPQSFDGGATDFKCQPGSYTVTVSLENYTTQTRSFQVGAGEHHAEQFHLVVDSAIIANLLADAKAKLNTGNFTGAVESARKLVKLTPGEAKEEEILAEATFGTGDFQSFIAAGITAIHAGGEVTVPLMHVHFKAIGYGNPYSKICNA